MAGTTTAFCNSFKAELPSGYHNFLAQQTPTGTTANNGQIITGMSSTVGLGQGMLCANSNLATGTYLSQILGTTSVRIDTPATASATGTTLTISGDQFAMALVKVTPTGTYGAATTNYNNLTSNTDEVTGTGYVAGGYQWALTANISPAVSNGVGIWSWGVNPSWTSASFSCVGGIIYNQSSVRSGTSGRSCSVEDFGGTQTVSNGTFTVVLPSNASGTAILRIA